MRRVGYGFVGYVIPWTLVVLCVGPFDTWGDSLVVAFAIGFANLIGWIQGKLEA